MEHTENMEYTENMEHNEDNEHTENMKYIEDNEYIELPKESYIDKLIESDYEIDDEILLALDISKEEQIQRIIQQTDEEYNMNILKEIRIKSLEMFCKKIKGLHFSENDRKIKNYIENILYEYFHLNIDYIYVDDDMYNKLYEIIDSYYLIPSKNKKSKTFISYEEDNIIRTIFLKKINL